MKTLLALAAVLFSLTAASSAVTYDIVSVSVVVKASSVTGTITTTTLNNRKYITKVSTDNTIPASDLFVGLNETTGNIVVVQKSTKIERYGIVFNLTGGGTAQNGSGSVRSITAGATLSSLNFDFSGSLIYETQKRNTNGSVKSVSRLGIGGSGNQTIKGTYVTTGRKINL